MMVKSESLQARSLEEGDLLVCGKSGVAHIVFLQTLCSIKMLHSLTWNGARSLWTKIGVCRNGQDYDQVVELLGYKACRSCSQSLRRYASKAAGKTTAEEIEKPG